MKRLVTIFLMAVACNATGQIQSMMFEKTWGIDQQQFYNGIIYADQLQNGDYFLIGYTNITLSGYQQNYACRTDSVGEIIWERIWGVPDVSCQFSHVISCNDNTYLAVGTGLSGMGGGISDISASRIDVNGNVMFTKYYDFTYEDIGFCITRTVDSNFVFGGIGGAANTWQPRFVKIDIDGNEIWRRTQATLTNYSPLNLAATSDGGFLAVGRTDTDNSYYSRFDSSGLMNWIKYPFGLTTSMYNVPGAIRPNADGTFDLLCSIDSVTSSPPYYARCILEHCNDQGDTIWTKMFQQSIRSVAVRQNDSTLYGIVGGNGYGEINSSYDLISYISMPVSSFYLYDYCPTRDGGWLGCGYKTGVNTSLFHIVKFGPDGRYVPQPFYNLYQVYPNPALDGKFTVSFDVLTDEDVSVVIYSVEGKLIYEEKIFCPAGSHTELHINLNTLTSVGGLYIIEVRTGTESRKDKIIVTRKLD